jgi:PAS domain-containing protein
MKTAAQELQDRVILMLDTLNEGIWDWPDVGASTFWWSPRFYELLGYAPNATEATLEHASRPRPSRGPSSGAALS